MRTTLVILVLTLCLALPLAALPAGDFTDPPFDGIEQKQSGGPMDAITSTFFGIYAVGSEQANPFPLPEYARDLFDINHYPSLPSYVREVTNGYHTMTGIAFGDGENCFWIPNQVTPSNHSGSWYNFAVAVIAQAQNVFDFRPYADANDQVYGTILCPIPCGNGIYANYTITTNQQMPDGHYVKYVVQFQETTEGEGRMAALLAHEWGHGQGFPDAGYYSLQYGLGGYDAMGASLSGSGPGMGFWINNDYGTVIPSLFNPNRRITKGWMAPTVVGSNVTQMPLYDISLGYIYKLQGTDPNQYFLVTNHQRRQYYEQYWPNTGLIIWHVRSNVPDTRSNWEVVRGHPVDLETAYGLYDWHLGSTPGDTFIIGPNPIGGKDSLDIRGIYGNPLAGPMLYPIGSASDFYPGAKNVTSFSPYTNPSSNFYNTGLTNLPENAYSNLAVLNITKNATKPIIYADMIKDVSPAPPAVPNAVRGNDGTYYVDVSWPANSEPDVTQYEVWRKEFGAPYFRALVTGTTYRDQPISGGRYAYSIKAVDNGGNRSGLSPYSARVIVPIEVDPHEEEKSSGKAPGPYAAPIPASLELCQNSPNPSNYKTGTAISYSLPRSDFVRLAVYNINGQLVKTLIGDQKTAGWHTVNWDNRDNNGKPVSEGIYVYNLCTSTGRISKRMIVIR